MSALLPETELSLPKSRFLLGRISIESELSYRFPYDEGPLLLSYLPLESFLYAERPMKLPPSNRSCSCLNSLVVS
uniref:Uncharacterized protein n=1 Tax=Arundo donax TaxID=35708 RepID=A0A0A9DJI5_ARUDO